METEHDNIKTEFLKKKNSVFEPVLPFPRVDLFRLAALHTTH